MQIIRSAQGGGMAFIVSPTEDGLVGEVWSEDLSIIRGQLIGPARSETGQLRNDPTDVIASLIRARHIHVKAVVGGNAIVHPRVQLVTIGAGGRERREVLQRIGIRRV